MVRKCRLCQFWEAKGGASDTGECRIHVPVKTDQWPVTEAQGWCGEYRYKIQMKQDVPHLCRYCEYWEHEPGETEGECRRHAPSGGPEEQQVGYPRTHEAQWCGEFEQCEGKLAIGTDACPVRAVARGQ